MFVDGGSRSAYPFPGFRPCASIASPYLPSRLAGEALPPPLDISPGSRAEWDFNPPDTSAVRHAQRTSPPPQAPGLSLAGFQLVIPDHALGLPVLRALSLCTCCRHCPGAAAGPHSLTQPSRISLPRKGYRVGLRIVLFEACSAFTRVTACTLALSPSIVTRYPKASATSSPP